MAVTGDRLRDWSKMLWNIYCNGSSDSGSLLKSVESYPPCLSIRTFIRGIDAPYIK